MTQRAKIVEVFRVTDCETGIYQQNELDFCVPVIAVDWLDAKPSRRGEVAEFLRWLAGKCESGSAPFNSVPPPKEDS